MTGLYVMSGNLTSQAGRVGYWSGCAQGHSPAYWGHRPFQGPCELFHHVAEAPCAQQTLQILKVCVTFYTFGERALRIPGNPFHFFKLKIQVTEFLFSLTKGV